MKYETELLSFTLLELLSWMMSISICVVSDLSEECDVM